MTEQTGRSLRLTPEQQANANTALSKFGSKADLAAALPMSRTTINKFFKGESVQVKNFHAICKKLKFDWQPEPATPLQSNTANADIDELVREVRDRIRPIIQERCGTMRVLDMSQPIGLGEIYTHVNILEKITGRARRELAELVREVAPENFERFSLGDVVEKRVPGLEAVGKHSKLMILGKPGAGKTTFLKHLAIQCIGGAFQSDRVPLFITLKDFAEADDQPDLITFIDQAISAISTSPPSHNTQQILDSGRALILLDGLDEVRETDASRVLRQIQQFSERYSRNAFVITCRIAAREYTFQQFSEVEVADFDDEQIADFSEKWFRSRKEFVRTEDFLQKLNEKPPIRKLATSPLLLSLLCLIFENSGDFPAKRSSIYEQGIEQLLREWNPHERERCPFYKELSPDYRQSLLRYIAAETFEKGNYFFNQQEAGKLIKEYIESLGCFTPRELLKLDSQMTLQTIEAQHGLLIERANGIYSFSHLTFHEYFASLEITKNSSLEVLQQLATHITEKRWYEVLLLTTKMLQPADNLLRLMKQQVDELIAEDEKLQEFLSWVNGRARSEDTLYKPAAMRVFYFALIYAFERYSDPVCQHPLFLIRYLFHDHDRHFDHILTHNLVYSLDLAHIYQLAHAYARDLDRIRNPDLNRFHARNLDLAHNLHYACTRNLDSELRHKIQALQEQLLGICGNDSENIEQWGNPNQQNWTKQLRALMIQYCGIGHDWQFDDTQKKKLQQYYDANQLLMNCLNSDCYVSREVRQEIEDTLLLPISEIEKRRKTDVP